MPQIHEVSTINVVLNETEAALVAGLLQHVRLGSEGWNSVAADIAIALSEQLCDCQLPRVEFTFEDRNGNEIEMSNIFVTVEVNDKEGDEE